MSVLSLQSLQHYRAQTHRTLPGRRLNTAEEAIAYVNERGFVYFWPIQEVVLPSLWVAAAGDRPVADAHDDPGHKTWGWKDDLLGKRVWYYAKVLRKKSTMIALEVAPYFYALSENYGSPEEDYLTLYEQGRLTQEARLVYETLLKEGRLDTIALRKATRLASRESDSRFNKAITDLQADFKILPVGVSQAGRWNYAFFYDIVTRHYPDLPDQTRFIGERQARQKLAELYLRSVGAAQLRDLTRLFGWPSTEAGRALDELVQANVLCQGLEVEGQKGEWYALKELEVEALAEGLT
jgi:hypothetical protein